MSAGGRDHGFGRSSHGLGQTGGWAPLFWCFRCDGGGGLLLFLVVPAPSGTVPLRL